MNKFLHNSTLQTKTNSAGYWFKRKCYGWGWTPASWQGWSVTLLIIGLVLANAIRFESGGYPDAAVLEQVVLPTFVLMAILIGICYKTGESPRWQWGESDKSGSESAPDVKEL